MFQMNSLLAWRQIHDSDMEWPKINNYISNTLCQQQQKLSDKWQCIINQREKTTPSQADKITGRNCSKAWKSNDKDHSLCDTRCSNVWCLRYYTVTATTLHSDYNKTNIPQHDTAYRKVKDCIVQKSLLVRTMAKHMSEKINYDKSDLHGKFITTAEVV